MKAVKSGINPGQSEHEDLLEGVLGVVQIAKHRIAGDRFDEGSHHTNIKSVPRFLNIIYMRTPL